MGALPGFVALLAVSACAQRGAANGADVSPASQLQALLDSAVSLGIPGMPETAYTVARDPRFVKLAAAVARSAPTLTAK